MYRLTADRPMDIFSDYLSETSELPSLSGEYSLSSLYGNNYDSGFDSLSCILMTMLKILLVVLVVHYIYKIFIKNRENFDVSKPNNDDKTSLHDLFTKNCKPEYCGILDWPTGDKERRIPKDHSLNNMSTADGCCVIPDKLKEYINDSRGGNSKQTGDISKDIKITSYIRN